MEKKSEKQRKTYTGGNVVVEDIKVGDIHYEYDYGVQLKVQVVTAPVKNRDQWSWKSKQVSNGTPIDYLITEGMSHYAPKLYDYEAYAVNTKL